MKTTMQFLRFTLFLSLSFFFNWSYASVIIPNANGLESKNVTASPAYQNASMFVKLSAKEFEKARGEKLNFMEKLYFKTVQRKLKRELKQDPDVTISQYYDVKKEKFKLDSLWFVIGAIIGPLGILFAFTSKQKRNFRISAALGSILFFIWFGYLFLF
ncbi:MAG: hypothetical protein ABIP35_16540 [Ginsengibacter sp.]